MTCRRLLTMNSPRETVIFLMHVANLGFTCATKIASCEVTEIDITAFFAP